MKRNYIAKLTSNNLEKRWEEVKIDEINNKDYLEYLSLKKKIKQNGCYLKENINELQGLLAKIENRRNLFFCMEIPPHSPVQVVNSSSKYLVEQAPEMEKPKPTLIRFFDLRKKRLQSNIQRMQLKFNNLHDKAVILNKKGYFPIKFLNLFNSLITKKLLALKFNISLSKIENENLETLAYYIDNGWIIEGCLQNAQKFYEQKSLNIDEYIRFIRLANQHLHYLSSSDILSEKDLKELTVLTEKIELLMIKEEKPTLSFRRYY